MATSSELRHCGIHWPGSNVRPDSSIDDSTHEILADAEQFGRYPLKRTVGNHSTDHDDVGFGEFGLAVPAARWPPRRAMSALPDGVNKIIAVRSLEQVADASPIVSTWAVMAREHLRQECPSKGEFKRHAICPVRLPATASEVPVAPADIEAISPEPTGARLVDLGPEPGDVDVRIMVSHPEPPTRGAMPSAVCTGARVFAYGLYHA